MKMKLNMALKVAIIRSAMDRFSRNILVFVRILRYRNIIQITARLPNTAEITMKPNTVVQNICRPNDWTNGRLLGLSVDTGSISLVFIMGFTTESLVFNRMVLMSELLRELETVDMVVVLSMV